MVCSAPCKTKHVNCTSASNWTLPRSMVLRSVRAWRTSWRGSDSWPCELVSRSVLSIVAPLFFLKFLFHSYFFHRELSKNEFTPHITTASGSQSPKPSFSWSRACVSGNESRGQVRLCFVFVVQSCALFVQSTVYLCEGDWLVFGNVICILAGEHSTVTTVHLLWDFLKGRDMLVCIVQKLCYIIKYIITVVKHLFFMWMCVCFIF